MSLREKKRLASRRRHRLLDKRALSLIQVGRLTLRRPDLADRMAIFRYATDPQTSRFLAWRPHGSEAITRGFLIEAIEAWEGEARLPWVIVVEGEVVGMIEAKLSGRNAGIGYVLSPAVWGQGIASEALGLVSDALFQYSPVSAIWALCVTQNPASARVLEKCGYEQEKLIPGYFHCPNLSEDKQDVWRYVRYRYLVGATKTEGKPV